MNFRLVFIIVSFVLLILIGYLINRKKSLNKTAGFIWFLIFSLMIISTLRRFQKKEEVDKNDIYGEYIIDTTQFYGKHAKWQYNHYRFEIKRNNKIAFHLTEKSKIVKTYIGTVEFLEAYKRPRIVVHFEKPVYHIVNQNPTLYRKMWSFYYVFNSSKFGNVFFKKDKWKPIDELN